MEISLEQLRELVAAALYAKFGGDSYDSPLYCVVATYPDYVIARGPNADLYRIAFTFASDDGDADADDITLGDPQPVEVAYVPVTQEAIFSLAGADHQGRAGGGFGEQWRGAARLHARGCG